MERLKNLEELSVNTIRALAMDAIQKANSGHPGLPLGAADFAYVLWMRFLKHNPADPHWPDRDRFVLSAGHGSMLLYALLHLFGYDLSLEELKQFRQWGSRTPGHPEYGLTPGVETTTGPLGQGFGNGVGMALAERILAAHFNEGGEEIIDHYTYGLVSDGDLMEGVSSEAASLAGHWGLGKLIYFYDDNRITIDGSTNLTFTEDVKKHYQGYGWQVIKIDGHNREAIAQAIKSGQREKAQPTLIIGRTHIAKGSPNKQDTAEAHGAPLGEEEVKATKESLGFPLEPPFLVPEEVRSLFEKRHKELKAQAGEWQRRFSSWRKACPERAALWDTFMSGKIPADLKKNLPNFEAGKSLATRSASGEILQVIASYLPNFMGGSADLTASTKTFQKGFSHLSREDFSGRNIYFGIREHAMGAILNGMSLHGGLRPYGGTFFIFSDYMRPALRMAAMMKQPIIYIYSHDSIFVGEDGPTHQPVEHLAVLRAIPNLTVIRPADATETAIAWMAALEHKKGPVALILTRQSLPVLDRNELTPAEELRRGAYVISGGDIDSPDILLIASGSEVCLTLEAQKLLAIKGKTARIINMPSWELFDAQPEEYRRQVFSPRIPLRLVIEAGCSQGWHRYLGDFGEAISMDCFGASALHEVLGEKFGFTAEQVAAHALRMIERFPEKAAKTAKALSRYV